MSLPLLLSGGSPVSVTVPGLTMSLELTAPGLTTDGNVTVTAPPLAMGLSVQPTSVATGTGMGLLLLLGMPGLTSVTAPPLSMGLALAPPSSVTGLAVVITAPPLAMGLAVGSPAVTIQPQGTLIYAGTAIGGPFGVPVYPEVTAYPTGAGTTLGLAAPGVTTSSGTTSVTITAPALALGIAVGVPAVGTGTGAGSITAPALALGLALGTPIVTTVVAPAQSVTVTAPALQMTMRLHAPVAVGQGEVVIVRPEFLPEGTLVGAYRRWEWKGSELARLGAGPGSAVQEVTLAADLTATFIGLEDGEWVAYAPTFPNRRLFFMVGQP